MNFLVDRCAGRRLTQWLQSQGHDTLDARELGPDPGDRALLERAVSENSILITMDKEPWTRISVNSSTSTADPTRG